MGQDDRPFHYAWIPALVTGAVAAFTFVFGTAALDRSSVFIEHRAAREASFYLVAFGTIVVTALWRVRVRRRDPEAYRGRGAAWLLEEGARHARWNLLLGLIIGVVLIVLGAGLDALRTRA